MIIITFDVTLTNLGYAVKYCDIRFIFKYFSLEVTKKYEGFLNILC